MRMRLVARDDRNCLLGFGRTLEGLVRDFYHFHPKLVSWSPAYTNCYGLTNPFASNYSLVAVCFESKNFLMPPIILAILNTDNYICFEYFSLID
jgi:hypothetical protein